MKNKAKALSHLKKARTAVLADDHATGMHHLGHALSALRGASTDTGASTMAPKKNFIAGAVKKKGALHRNLGVPQGQKIGAARINAATHSSNPTIRKEAILARTLRSFNHRKG